MFASSGNLYFFNRQNEIIHALYLLIQVETELSVNKRLTSSKWAETRVGGALVDTCTSQASESSQLTKKEAGLWDPGPVNLAELGAGQGAEAEALASGIPASASSSSLGKKEL